MRRGQILRHEVIVGVERRRFWPDEMKLSILREIGVGGATVTDVAQRHDVTRQHIYQWRRQLKDKGLWPEPKGVAFLSLDAPELPATCKLEPTNSAPAEIGFANGRTLRCPPGMDEADIMRLIRLVETA
ncbi:transposase [Marivita sp.]|jgi:transposase|uniref:transposase n=1 Tax=Marivita sp. TaxID=2003365 RepID=UPI003B51C1B8